VYTMDRPGPVICMYVRMYVWERFTAHSDPQIHLFSCCGPMGIRVGCRSHEGPPWLTLCCVARPAQQATPAQMRQRLGRGPWLPSSEWLVHCRVGWQLGEQANTA
jgi:hypothetical protein